MSEAETMSRVKQPNTVTGLSSDLRKLGLAKGQALIAHSSLSAIGWTAGGAQAVVEALLAHLYARDGMVLLLGVDHGNNTSLHLAEYRSGVPAEREHHDLFVQVDVSPPDASGLRRVRFSDRELDSEGFARIGAEWEAQAQDADLSVGRVGAAHSRLVRQRPIVDYACRRLAELRST